MKTWPYPLWIAHRGAGTLAPENTLAALRIGAQHGYRAFECDVKLSSDDVLFLLHDTTLERTTSGSGTAGQRPWSELSRLDAGGWHGRGHAGEPIPSLDAIAGFVRRNGYALNIEIKPTPGSEEATGRAVALAVRQLWQSATLPPLLSSFSAPALRAALDTAPEVPRALLVDSLGQGWLEAARALQCVAVVAKHTLMNETLMAQVHGAGMRALCYTVNDAAEAQRLLALGIDGIITDAVDRLSPVEPRF